MAVPPAATPTPRRPRSATGRRRPAPQGGAGARAAACSATSGDGGRARLALLPAGDAGRRVPAGLVPVSLSPAAAAAFAQARSEFAGAARAAAARLLVCLDFARRLERVGSMRPSGCRNSRGFAGPGEETICWGRNAAGVPLPFLFSSPPLAAFFKFLSSLPLPVPEFDLKCRVG